MAKRSSQRDKCPYYRAFFALPHCPVSAVMLDQSRNDVMRHAWRKVRAPSACLPVEIRIASVRGRPTSALRPIATTSLASEQVGFVRGADIRKGLLGIEVLAFMPVHGSPGNVVGTWSQV
jgi:hypothetical protein